jgi:multidrug efflux pump subunit AcrB
VTSIDIEGQAIMTFAVSAPGLSIEELSWFVDDTIKRQLQGKTGIGKIERYGGADREIRVELDPVRLDSYGITASSVSQQLSATNADGGRADARGHDQDPGQTAEVAGHRGGRHERCDLCQTGREA